MADNAARQKFTMYYEDSLRLDRERGVFIYSVKSSLNVRDRIGDTRVLFSADDGRDLGFTHPYIAGGNAVSQWLGALHTGRVGGLPYRMLLSLMGTVVAMLSVTGVVVWWKKRSARTRKQRERSMRLFMSEIARAWRTSTRMPNGSALERRIYDLHFRFIAPASPGFSSVGRR
jgi:uncharacterized iron-regulated membrane protein